MAVSTVAPSTARTLAIVARVTYASTQEILRVTTMLGRKVPKAATTPSPLMPQATTF